MGRVVRIDSDNEVIGGVALEGGILIGGLCRRRRMLAPEEEEQKAAARAGRRRREGMRGIRALPLLGCPAGDVGVAFLTEMFARVTHWPSKG